MTDAAFVIPTYRRQDMTRACLAGMRWTCDAVGDTGYGRKVTCVVVTNEDAITQVAKDLDFHYVSRPNYSLGRKWNDGIEYAARKVGADVVIPCGSDDIVHPLLLEMQIAARQRRLEKDQPWIVGSNRLTTVVSNGGEEMSFLRITYDGGDGIRVLPRELLGLVDFRPADDDRQRAMDTSMKMELEKVTGSELSYEYQDYDPMQVVDFKTERQLNSYEDCKEVFGVGTVPDPFTRLSEIWPHKVLDPIREVYERRRVAE